MPDEIEQVIAEMDAIRKLYGEVFPFDPSASGFDSVLSDSAYPGRKAAVCRMMNALLNDGWAACLRAWWTPERRAFMEAAMMVGGLELDLAKFGRVVSKWQSRL